MHIEIEIFLPETGAREKHRCWETARPHVYQTIVGAQIINVHVDRENVCQMVIKGNHFEEHSPKDAPIPMKGGLTLQEAPQERS